MSPTLKFLLEYKHRPKDKDLAELSKEDTEVLVKDLSDRTSSYGIEKIIEILTRINDPRAKEQLLQILSDQKEDPALRSLVATQVARFEEPRLEELYLRILDEKDLSSILKFKVIKSLGKIGTGRSYERLLKITAEQPFENIATLGCLLISSRERIPTKLVDNLKVEKKDLLGNKFPVELRVVTDEKELNFENHDRYGISALPGSFQYSCGKSNYAILFDKNIEEKAPGLRLHGIIGLRSLHDDIYNTNYLIFQNAGADIKKGAIFIFRTDGQLRYSGEVKDDQFMIASNIGLPNEEIDVKGSKENNRMRFTHIFSSNRISTKLVAKPLRFDK